MAAMLKLPAWLLLTAAATLVTAQYDEASFQSWQPSRTRKSQTPSLLRNVQSSPQFSSSQGDVLPVTSQGVYTPFRPTGSARKSRVYQQPTVEQNVAVAFSASVTGFGAESFHSGDSFPTSRGRFANREPFSTSEATAVLPDDRDESPQPFPRRGGASSNRNRGSADNSEFYSVERTTRGYQRTSTAAPSVPSDIRPSNERSRGRHNPRTTLPSPRSFVSSNTPTSIESSVREASTPRTRTAGQFSQNARKIKSEETIVNGSKPPSRFPTRSRAAPTARGSTRTSSESSSVEETLSPSLSFTTEGPSAQVPSTSTSTSARSFTRGKVRASTSQPEIGTTPRSRQINRGNKKAAIAKELTKSNGEISDEDNYPKEFIEKIKNSAGSQMTPNMNPIRKPIATSNKFGRARPALSSLSRPSIDPDISESSNDEVIVQNVPVMVKPKETSPVSRHRFFGKSKASTTSTEQPTTKQSSNQASSIDKMRERYNNLLKASQEERLKKLASMRSKFSQPKSADEQSSTSAEPIIENDGPTSTSRSIYSSSSRFSHSSRKGAGDKSSPVAQDGVRFRPRSSLISRQPDPSIEPATPTVADSARSRNRYSRRSKEELSVEAPEAKTFPASSDSPHDSIFNFVHLRTNLTPLASEDVISSFLSNELGETTSSSTELSSTSEEVMTSTTIRGDSSSMETSEPTMMDQFSAETTRLGVESTTASSGNIEMTTMARQDPFTMVTPSSTIVTEQPETAAPSQQSFPSTRHRFSSRYNGSTSSVPPKYTEVPKVESELTSTLSAINLSTPLTSDLLSTTTVPPTLSSALTSTTFSSSSAQTSSAAPTTSRMTTTQRSFLDDRPILKSIVSLFTTTTTRPTTVQTKSKAKNKPAKKPATTTTRPPKTTKTTARLPKTTKVVTAKLPVTKPTTTTMKISTSSETTTMRAILTTTEDVSNNTISPLALSVNVEEVLNSTQELIKNHSTSFGSDFSKVPRDELDALTPMAVLNTTEANDTSTVTPEPSTTQSVVATSTERDVKSQPIFFVGVLATSPSPIESRPPAQIATTPSTTTAGDYFVYGIYPNNTVVRKRAWKTFDYERYMSPYVIFGIYPNNTIVKKFPNGTVINDEFMTSDNEVAGPSLSATTVSTTTSQATSLASAISPLTTVAPTTEKTSPVPITLTTPNDGGSDSSPTTEISPGTTTVEQTEATTEATEPTEAAAPDTTENNEVIDEIVLKSNFDILVTTERLETDEVSIPTTVAVTESVTESSTAVAEGSSTVAAATTTTSPTTKASNEEDDVTTINPTVNQVLPLTLDEVRSFWSGNFSDAPADRPLGDRSFFNGINFLWNENRMPSSEKGKPISLSNIAFRALATTNDEPSRVTIPFIDGTTTEEATTTTMDPMTTTRKPRVKFVTVTPRFMTTTMNYEDVEDSATLPSQHVQRVSKASTQLPEDVFTNLFGSLEQEASSPIPDFLKDVNEVEGDGLTAALARRIIALAMERAKSTTPETITTTTMVPTTEMMTTPPPMTSTIKTKTAKKKPAGRAIASPSEGELRNVLEQLIKAQDTLALSTGQTSVTSMKPPAELEKTVENQLRLAEEVRKASRNMKKKKKKSRPTTTTPAPRPILGFLFNFFNRPATTEKPPTPVPSRTKVPSSESSPDSQLLFLTSVPDDSQSSADEETAGNNEVQGERQTRSQLLTAAIDVTRAVGKLMGTVMTSAAQSFQSFVRTNWGR